MGLNFIIGMIVATVAIDSSPATDPSDSAYVTPYKLGRLVVSKSAIPGTYDVNLVDDPFVFRAQNSFWMLFIGHDGIGYQTGLARSSDLVHWDKTGIVFPRDAHSDRFRYNAVLDCVLKDPELHGSGELIKVNGKYLATWHAYPQAGYEQGAAIIGLAWSTDLVHWQAGETILRPEDGAAWERGGLYRSYLMRKDGVYYLYYNAKDHTEHPWHEQSGVAISTDLTHWRRFSGNPVIRNGGDGSSDRRFASNPYVVTNAGEWGLYYFGLDGAGTARSLLAIGHDPYRFQKDPRIMIDVGANGEVDSTHAHKSSPIYWHGVLYHFYCAVSGHGANEQRGITVATSAPWTEVSEPAKSAGSTPGQSR